MKQHDLLFPEEEQEELEQRVKEPKIYMKHLFVALTGEIDKDTRRVEAEHRNYIREYLSKEIREIIGSGSVYILSSTSPEALESAGILMVNLGIGKNFERMPFLWTGLNGARGNYSKKPINEANKTLMDKIKEKSNIAEALIIMAQKEVCRDFPVFYCEERLEMRYDLQKLEPGEAVHFDLTRRSYDIVPERVPF